MAQMAQQPVLKMEVNDSCVCAQHMVGRGEVKISRRVGAIRRSHGRRSVASRIVLQLEVAEAVGDAIDAPCLILDVEIELLQVCGPLLMAVILQFTLFLHELQRLMISVNDSLLPENIMPPLSVGLYNGVHFFVISGVLTDGI
jgi:hypothetical protein